MRAYVLPAYSASQGHLGCASVAAAVGKTSRTDQAEELFARGLLKPTWYQKEELLKHVESEKTSSVP